MKTGIIVFIILLILIGIVSYFATKNGRTTFISLDEVDPAFLPTEQLPANYVSEAAEQGSLQRVEYTTVAKGEEITKHAMVYLPYEYDSSKQYDVLYLMHGRGGKYNTWLGTKKNPKEFKNVLDNMIQNEEIRPLIVVTPGLTYAYGDKDTKKKDEASDMAVVSGTADEICDSLMPIIDSSFSTKKDRANRCMAGFSMGGSTTWHMFMNHTDCFYYYIPMSMALYFDKAGYSETKSLKAVQIIDEKIKKTGYSQNDYKIYVATGDQDHKSIASAGMVEDLINHTSQFTYADPEYKTGNILLNIWPGRWHSYKTSFPYLYNGLKKFFKPEH